MIQGDDAEIQEAAAADTAAISQGFLASQLEFYPYLSILLYSA